MPQSDSDLEAIGQLFSQFLMGHNSTLTTKGDSVQPPGADGPITWLSTAFQTLTLDIILPGQQFDVIKAIQLDDLAITMREQDQTFAPPASSSNTIGQYANPFGFSLQAVEAAQRLVLSAQGTDVAEVGYFQSTLLSSLISSLKARPPKTRSEWRGIHRQYCRTCDFIREPTAQVAQQ